MMRKWNDCAAISHTEHTEHSDDDPPTNANKYRTVVALLNTRKIVSQSGHETQKGLCKTVSFSSRYVHLCRLIKPKDLCRSHISQTS